MAYSALEEGLTIDTATSREHVVAGKRAEHNPDKNRLTIQFLFPKQNGGKGDAGEIILINRDVLRIIVRALEAVMVETESWRGW